MSFVSVRFGHDIFVSSGHVDATGRDAQVWPLEPEDTWPPLFVDDGGPAFVGHTFYVRGDAEPRPVEWPVPDASSKGPLRKWLIDLAGRLGRELIEVRVMVAGRQRREAEGAKLVGEVRAAGASVAFDEAVGVGGSQVSLVVRPSRTTEGRARR